MIETILIGQIARVANLAVVELLHAQMQGYNARLAPKTNRNADLIAAFTGTVKKIPAKKSRR